MKIEGRAIDRVWGGWVSQAPSPPQPALLLLIFYPLTPSTANFHLADTSLLRTLTITELWTLSWYQSDNFIVLILNKTDTTYFSYIT